MFYLVIHFYKSFFQLLDFKTLVIVPSIEVKIPRSPQGIRTVTWYLKKSIYIMQSSLPTTIYVQNLSFFVTEI